MSETPRFSATDFEAVAVDRQLQAVSRPSLSYWQDSWRRLKQNRRAFASLGMVVALGVLTLAGPFVWRLDPAAQDVNQISQAPSFPPSALIVEPYTAWSGVTAEPTRTGDVVTGLHLAETATTQAVRLAWEPVLGATGYVVYRSVYDQAPDRALGLPVGEVVGADRVSFEDRLDLEPRRYWYAVVVMDENRAEVEDYAALGTEPGSCHHCHTGRCPVGVATQDPDLEARLDVDAATRRVRNYLATMVLEAQTLARACGKSHLLNLEPEDLAALTIEAAAMAGVPLAGTDWIPGKS